VCRDPQRLAEGEGARGEQDEVEPIDQLRQAQG